MYEIPELVVSFALLASFLPGLAFAIFPWPVSAASFETGVYIVWRTSVAGTFHINYGSTASYGSSSTTVCNNSSNGYVTYHCVVLSSLTAGTTYRFRVSSTDRRGNTVNSKDYTFTTLASPTGTVETVEAGGMATGGRVVHHLERCLPDHRNTILFVGFQAAGTRGRLIQAGQPVKMHGQYIHVRARIETLENLSGHADYGEILGWLRKFHKPPGKTFLVHGELQAAESLRQKVAQELQWDVSVASYLQKVQL